MRRHNLALGPQTLSTWWPHSRHQTISCTFADAALPSVIGHRVDRDRKLGERATTASV
jgi:hypothetical protein